MLFMPFALTTGYNKLTALCKDGCSLQNQLILQSQAKPSVPVRERVYLFSMERIYMHKLNLNTVQFEMKNQFIFEHLFHDFANVRRPFGASSRQFQILSCQKLNRILKQTDLKDFNSCCFFTLKLVIIS